MKLTESLKGLICEIAAVDSLQDAINRRQVVTLYYQGDDPGGKGIREVEPVALGRSTAGNLVMRGWDREGASHTAYEGEQPLPGWRLFSLDKILTLQPTGEVYNEPHPGYNFKGDKGMSEIITIAKFDNNEEPQAPPAAPPASPETPPQNV